MKKKIEPEITILMSVYNHAPFLDEAIQSILNQSLHNFEFLIFDDCSNDNSGKILKKYANNDDRIKLIVNEQNYGLGHNLARGVEMAKGKYIGRMDSDDISLPHRLETQYNFLENNKSYDLVGSYAIQIDQDGKEFGIRNVPPEHDDIVKYMCLCTLIHPTVMFKKDKIIKAGNYKDLRKKQDYHLWLRCVDNNLKFKNFEEPLLKFRYGDNFLERYNYKSQWQFAKIGFAWCIKRRAGIKSYIRVLYKLVRGIGPIAFRKKFARFYENFDKNYF